MRHHALTILFLGTLSFSTPVIAQVPSPPLPPLLANCKVEGGTAPFSYNSCFIAPSVDYYGRLFIRFDMATFNFDQVASALDKERKRSLLKRVKSFFLPKTTEGSLVATVTLMPANIVVGVQELARFKRSDSKGITINSSSSSLNGYASPFFKAENGTAQLSVKVRYVFTKDQGSILSSLIADATKLLSGEGFLSGKPVLSQPALEAVKAVEAKITEQFKVAQAIDNDVQLSFNPGTTMAVYRAIPFGDILDNSAQLFLAAVPLRSALVDLPPNDLDKHHYTNGGYGMLATNPIRNRTIRGVSLKDYVSEKMGSQYTALDDGSDKAKFLQACQTLKAVVEDTTLSFSADDQLAATWAFIAANPLLSQKDVRQQYCLHASEVSGDLKRPLLDLPKVDAPPPTDLQAAVLAPAIVAAEKAATSQASAQSAINVALEAMNKANLPVAPSGYEKKLNGLSEYHGQNMVTPGRFYGTFVDLVSTRKGNHFEGSMILSGSSPIFDGLGRYTPASGTGFAYKEYSGNFSANYFKGFGIMRWADGQEFHGEFANDEPAGHGILFKPDGRRFYGRFSGIQPVGNGDAVERTNDGTLKSGRWVSGTFIRD